VILACLRFAILNFAPEPGIFGIKKKFTCRRTEEMENAIKKAKAELKQAENVVQERLPERIRSTSSSKAWLSRKNC
jgi:predicted ATP-grasp superfamily ATP-dependent carboligase